MAEEKRDDGLPSLNLKSSKEKDTTSKAAGALLARMPKTTPSAMPQSGLLGRFRGMAKKDMGLMAAAGALMAMLPIAENFMMKPDKGVSSGKTGELFEPNGTVSYGAPGAGEMITPLTARDPLSLILAGEDEEPKAATAAPDESGGSGGGASDGLFIRRFLIRRIISVIASNGITIMASAWKAAFYWDWIITRKITSNAGWISSWKSSSIWRSLPFSRRFRTPGPLMI